MQVDSGTYTGDIESLEQVLQWTAKFMIFENDTHTSAMEWHSAKWSSTRIFDGDYTGEPS